MKQIESLDELVEKIKENRNFLVIDKDGGKIAYDCRSMGCKPFTWLIVTLEDSSIFLKPKPITLYQYESPEGGYCMWVEEDKGATWGSHQRTKIKPVTVEIVVDE